MHIAPLAAASCYWLDHEHDGMAPVAHDSTRAVEVCRLLRPVSVPELILLPQKIERDLNGRRASLKRHDESVEY
jgi:hypothetical protein